MTKIKELEKLLIDCVAYHKMRRGMAEYDAFMFAGDVLRDYDAAVRKDEQEQQRLWLERELAGQPTQSFPPKYVNP